MRKEGEMLKRWSTVGAIVALVATMTISPAAADQGGRNRPFKADLAGQVTFEFGAGDVAPCGSSQPGWGFTVITRTEATGTASHLGKARASFWHCPTDIGHDNGHLTLVAANGDEIYFEYVDDGTMGDSFPMHVVGGTGRFAGGAGSVILHYRLEPAIGPDGEPDFTAPWGWWATIEGVISY
jgi:hypothetical protein